MTCSSTFRTHQIFTVLLSASETTVHATLNVIRSLVVEIANQSESATDFRGRGCNGVFFHQPSALRSRAIMDYIPAASDNRGSVLSSSLCTIVRLRNRATSEAAFSLYCWRDAPLFTALIFFRGADGMAVRCSHKKAVNLPCVYRVRVAFWRHCTTIECEMRITDRALVSSQVDSMFFDATSFHRSQSGSRLTVVVALGGLSFT